MPTAPHGGPDGPDYLYGGDGDDLMIEGSVMDGGAGNDELHADAFISNPTWAALCEHLDEKQRVDLVFTVGQYNMVSMALNTLGVQPEPGLARLPSR